MLTLRNQASDAKAKLFNSPMLGQNIILNASTYGEKVGKKGVVDDLERYANLFMSQEKP